MMLTGLDPEAKDSAIRLTKGVPQITRANTNNTANRVPRINRSENENENRITTSILSVLKMLMMLRYRVISQLLIGSIG